MIQWARKSCQGRLLKGWCFLQHSKILLCRWGKDWFLRLIRRLHIQPCRDIGFGMWTTQLNLHS